MSGQVNRLYGSTINPIATRRGSVDVTASHGLHNSFGIVPLPAANPVGSSPLLAAAEHGQIVTMKLLLDATANPNLQTESADTANSWAPIHVAASKGHAQAIHTLVEANADVNLVNGASNTALFFAAREGHLGCVEALLQLQADPNHDAGAGGTPIAIAQIEGFDSIVKVLVASGERSSQ